MENDELEQLDALEGQEAAPSLEDLDYDALLQKTKESIAQKEHWRKKALKQKEAPQPPKNEEITQPKNSGEDEWKKRIEFVTGVGRDLDSEEVQTVIALAKGKGISFEEAAKDPVFTAFKKDRDATKRVEQSIPSAGRRSAVVEGKNFHTMSEAEKSSNFQAYLKQLSGK